VEADLKGIGAPREMLDSICVADCATRTASKELFRGPEYFSDRNAPMTSYNRHFSGEQDDGTAPLSTPISVFIADLLTRLARDEPFRFCWPSAVSRYLSWVFLRDHFRAAFPHGSLQ
jgi:hypothetical protein